MASVDTFQDPLTINLEHQTRIFLESVARDSPVHNILLGAPSRLDLLRQLSRIILLPAHTLAVASAFRPILIDLCARFLEDEADEVDKLEALCLLLELHPELFPCVARILYAEFLKLIFHIVLEYYRHSFVNRAFCAGPWRSSKTYNHSTKPVRIHYVESCWRTIAFCKPIGSYHALLAGR